MRNRRVEIDHPPGIGTNVWIQKVFELNLSLDEIAELVAIDWNFLMIILASEDLWDWASMCDFSLDAQVKGGLEGYDSTIIHREIDMWWHSLVATSDGGQYTHDHEFIHFPPGIFVAENPALNLYKDQDNAKAEANANLFYRVIKPSVTELAAIVARSR
ncbi:hypothetical protein ES705_44878 [subsurface metagenome]